MQIIMAVKIKLAATMLPDETIEVSWGPFAPYPEIVGNSSL